MPDTNLRWTVDDAYAARFTEPILNDIITRAAVKRETTVRQLAGRHVGFFSLKPEQLPDIFIKAYHIPPLKLFRSCLAPYGVQEWHAARDLLRRGVRTHPPIALGIERTWGLYRRVYLITEAVQGSSTLKQFVQQRGSLSHGAVPDLVGRFARFVVAVCRAGALHRDLHWGNILIRFDPAGVPSFYLIDLHNLRLKPGLSDRDIMHNLSLLNTSFYDRVSPRLQLRFLRTVLAESHGGRRDFLRARNGIVRQTEGLMRKKWRKHAARCFGENNYFMKVHLGPLTGHARRDDRTGACADVLHDPESLFYTKDARIIKDSRTTSSLLISPEGVEPGVYLKRFNVKAVLHPVKHLFKRSRAEAVWRAAHAMLARGVPTPRPRMYLEHRRSGFLGKSYFAADMVPGAVDLDTYLSAHANDLSRDGKKSVIRMLARELRKMHDRGVAHGDLKAKNILITSRDGIANGVLFVDLDAVRISPGLTQNERCRDLARLNCSFLDRSQVSGPQRLCFLKCYAGRMPGADFKKLWKRVLFFTLRKLKKSGRNFFYPHRT